MNAGNATTALSPRNQRYGSLDLWRGVACLSVVIYHSTILHNPAGTAATLGDSSAGGYVAAVGALLVAVTRQLWIGVPLFFVISGYCIAATADSSRRRGGSAKKYFVRRFRRIYPPYWAIVAGTAAFVALVDVVLAPRLLSSEPWPQLRPWWFSASQWFGNLTLTESWRHYLLGAPRGHFIGQSWTLCYEEQFYAVMGFLLVVTRHRLFLGIAVVSIATAAIALIGRRYDLPVDGFFFDGLWLQFAAGTVVYYCINYASPRWRLVLTAILCGGLAASLVSWSPTGEGGAAAFAFALLLLALHRWDGAICSTRLLRPLFFCGTICYSMYLAHPPLIRAVTKCLYGSESSSDFYALFVVAPVSVAIAVLAGFGCYLAVERWFLNAPQVAGTTTAGPINSRPRVDIGCLVPEPVGK